MIELAATIIVIYFVLADVNWAIGTWRWIKELRADRDKLLLDIEKYPEKYPEVVTALRERKERMELEKNQDLRIIKCWWNKRLWK